MPRVKKPPTEQQNSRIVGVIGYYQNYFGFTDRELALTVMVNKDTWKRRTANPENFKVKELERLARKFRIPITEFFEVGKKI